ncbi:hypothetical protein TWF706_004738 [Orbilia oligospora]|nr:hypothetical protein TWF706_004738 [Orbilia oligospora]
MQRLTVRNRKIVSWSHNVPTEIRTLIWHTYLQDYFNSCRRSEEYRSILEYLTINKDITSIILRYLGTREAYVLASKISGFLKFAGPTFRSQLRINVIWDLEYKYITSVVSEFEAASCTGPKPKVIYPSKQTPRDPGDIERTSVIQGLLSDLLRVGHLQRVEGIPAPHNEGSVDMDKDLLFTSPDVFLDLSSFEIDVELIQSIVRSWTREFPQAIKTFGSSPNSCRIKLPT